MAASPHPRALTGGSAVWIFMSVEVLTFGLFLLGHAWRWREQPQVFAASQALLHPESGARGTVILLLGSWCAYQAVLAHGGGRSPRCAWWLVAAAASGVAFSANKIVEYQSPELAAATLSTDAFMFSYLFLTQLHLLHVIGGVLLLSWLALRARAGAASLRYVQAGATCWHLIDVIWLLLFPTLYLMHP